MKLPRTGLLGAGIALVLCLVACASGQPAPTPNIEATVEARAKELVAEQVNNLQPNPDLGMDYLSRALGYSQSGDRQLAIGDYTKAIKLGIPTTHHSGSNPLAIAYLNRGFAYNGLGQYERAIEDFDRVISLDYDLSTLAYVGRGDAYRNLGRDAEADADKAKACSQDSEYC